MTMFRKVFSDEMGTGGADAKPNHSEKALTDVLVLNDPVSLSSAVDDECDTGQADLSALIDDVPPLVAEPSELPDHASTIRASISRGPSLQCDPAPEPPVFQPAPDVALRIVSAPAPVVAAPEPKHLPVAESMTPVSQAAPGRPAGRARTRLLGFNHGADSAPDPFADVAQQTVTAALTFPTSWIVIVNGPGKGQSFPIGDGAAMIGRGDDQAIRLDFSDATISRHNHAAIAYNDEDNEFYLGHGGKSNIIRLNDRPVLSTEKLSHGDSVRIGETTLRFVALCGPDFQWGEDNDDQ